MGITSNICVMKIEVLIITLKIERENKRELKNIGQKKIHITFISNG